MNLLYKTKSLYKNESGIAAIEIAIVLPLLILMIVGILEFGLWFLKDQIALNAIGNVSNAVQQNPTDATIQQMARDSGSTFMDLNNDPNYFCAQSYGTYDEAKAGTCSGNTWNTDKPNGVSGDYYVALRVNAQKISTGLFSTFLSDINRTQITKVSSQNSSSGVLFLTTPGPGTWSIPSGVKTAKVTIIGGGGSGCNGAYYNGNDFTGASGGGGGAAIMYFTNISTSSMQYNIGSGGMAPAASLNACKNTNDGTQTTFHGLYAPGGSAGTGNLNSKGGDAGVTPRQTSVNVGAHLEVFIPIRGSDGGNSVSCGGNSGSGCQARDGGDPGQIGNGGTGGSRKIGGNGADATDGIYGGGGGGGGFANSKPGNGGNGAILIEW